jgi:hypothetical protein
VDSQGIGGGSAGLQGFEALRGAAQKRLQKQDAERRLASALESKRAEGTGNAERTGNPGLSGPLAAAYTQRAAQSESPSGPQLGRFVDVRA